MSINLLHSLHGEGSTTQPTLLYRFDCVLEVFRETAMLRVSALQCRPFANSQCDPRLPVNYDRGWMPQWTPHTPTSIPSRVGGQRKKRSKSKKR